MRSLTRALIAGLVILGLLALGAGTSLASGGGGSAGNSQYVDPLSGNSHSGSGHSSSSANSSTTPTTTVQSSQPASPTLSPSAPSSVSSSAGSSSSVSAPAATSRTLPFTGLNLWACVGLGVGLLAAGLALRRALARAY